jgi:hypothetical protein
MKTVKAVQPYFHPGGLNFKQAPFEAWKRNGGKTARAWYPIRPLHSLAYNHELPSWLKTEKEARLRFLEPVSLYFDTFPDYALHEVIPMVWDCWPGPGYVDKMCTWIKKHDVSTAIFSSSQTANIIQNQFPDMNVMWCPEAVEKNKYKKGKPLNERSIDILEFGRSNTRIITNTFPENIRHICTLVNNKFIYSDDELYIAMSNAKITIALPRCDTDPKFYGQLETLTQRYWENILSRIVMIGRAPQELINMMGYNPVINIDKRHPQKQILDILAHIEDYQELVDKNFETAIKICDWDLRIKDVMTFLQKNGYKL